MTDKSYMLHASSNVLRGEIRVLVSRPECSLQPRIHPKNDSADLPNIRLTWVKLFYPFVLIFETPHNRWSQCLHEVAQLYKTPA